MTSLAQIPMALFFAAGVACVVCAGILLLLLRTGWAWDIAVDIPNHRSLHVRPVPRVGGWGVLPAMLLAVFVGLGLRPKYGRRGELRTVIRECRCLLADFCARQPRGSIAGVRSLTGCPSANRTVTWLYSADSCIGMIGEPQESQNRARSLSRCRTSGTSTLLRSTSVLT